MVSAAARPDRIGQHQPGEIALTRTGDSSRANVIIRPAMASFCRHRPSLHVRRRRRDVDDEAPARPSRGAAATCSRSCRRRDLEQPPGLGVAHLGDRLAVLVAVQPALLIRMSIRPQRRRLGHHRRHPRLVGDVALMPVARRACRESTPRLPAPPRRRCRPARHARLPPPAPRRNPSEPAPAAVITQSCLALMSRLSPDVWLPGCQPARFFSKGLRQGRSGP